MPNFPNFQQCPKRCDPSQFNESTVLMWNKNADLKAKHRLSLLDLPLTLSFTTRIVNKINVDLMQPWSRNDRHPK